MFGSRLTNKIVWEEHNPWNLAARLRGTSLFIATGNGKSGPYDHGHGSWIERQIYQMNVSFEKLNALRIRHVWDYYGPTGPPAPRPRSPRSGRGVDQPCPPRPDQPRIPAPMEQTVQLGISLEPMKWSGQDGGLILRTARKAESLGFG